MNEICGICEKEITWPEIYPCAYCSGFFCIDHRIAEKHDCQRVLAAKNIEKDYLRRKGVNITSGEFQVVCNNCGFKTEFMEIVSANEERENHIQIKKCPSKSVLLRQSEKTKEEDSKFVREGNINSNDNSMIDENDIEYREAWYDTEEGIAKYNELEEARRLSFSNKALPKGMNTSFIVQEAYRSLIGKNLAGISSAVMKTMNLSGLDNIIEIKGNLTTYARAYELESSDEVRIIRIDGLIRQQADTEINEKVTIKKVQVEEADEIKLAPLGASWEFNEDHEFIRNELFNQPLFKDGHLAIRYKDELFWYQVVKIIPDTVAKVTAKTKVSFDYGEVSRNTYEQFLEDRKKEKDEEDNRKMYKEKFNTYTEKLPK